MPILYQKMVLFQSGNQMYGHLLDATLFYSLENWIILFGFQMVTIFLVGSLTMSGIQMVGYQMPGSKAKWTI